MKKAIFLSNAPVNILSVYADTVCERLSGADMTDTIYTRADVEANPAAVADTEVIFSTWGMPSFTEEEIRTFFPRLEHVFYAAGSVQGFAAPFLACGVTVHSAWAANAVPVAEYTVAQIILANKGFFTHTRLLASDQRSEALRRRDCYPGNYGEKVGIIGCGMIGSMVAERLRAYHLEVLVFDPFLSRERAEALGVRIASLEELFSACRVVSNHLANNRETVGMLDGKLFSSMMPYATFINTGRGAQVVEDDLVRVLTEREDLTAILDVTDPEPPVKGHPFYTLPNCFLTPHVAGSLCNEVVRMGEYMADEFDRYLRGEHGLYEVTPEMLKTMA